MAIRSRVTSRSGFALALGAIAAFKLWLVHGEGIIGSATQYDALWYVRSASHWYWGSDYNWIAFIRPCAYPLWIALMHLLHVPLRPAIELLQMGGAVTLIFALRTLEVSRVFAVISFALMVLHPIGFEQNNYTMSDTFYAGMLWLVLGGLLLTLSRHSIISAILTGVAVAILWNAREEGHLLLAVVALATVLFFFPLLLGMTSPHTSWVRGLRTSSVLWGTAILIVLVSYTFNDLVFHSFARSEMTAPVFQSLYHSLLRIRPLEPKPYAPITNDTLQRAFAVSPTFAKLRGPLEGPMGEAWRVETYRRTGTPNEIGAGWIVWGTRQAASMKEIFASPRTARRFFTKAAQEINRACEDGRLPTRFVVDGFLDPFTQSGGLRRLPASLVRVSARAFARWDVRPISDDSILTTEEASLYNRMTLRGPSGDSANGGMSLSAERLIGQSYWLIMVLLHLLAGVAFVSLLFLGRHLKQYRGILYGVILLSGAVVTRILLLGWLDATAFDATQDRFLFPILPLWSVVLLIITCLGARAITARFERNS